MRKFFKALIEVKPPARFLLHTAIESLLFSLVVIILSTHN